MSDFLGVDIAKKTFDTVLLQSDRSAYRGFGNCDSGIDGLRAWLAERRVTDLHVCMEATGRYGEDLALALHADGVRVSMVNPSRIKAFAASEMVRAKTDKVDAGVIARFCQQQRPEAWTPPLPGLRRLRALVRRCANLKEMRAAELQRQQAGSADAVVGESMERVIAALDAEINAMSAEIDRVLEEDKGLGHQVELLESIPSIGRTSAVVMLSEVGDFSAFGHSKQITAFAGLDPAPRDSGAGKRQAHISKIGNARLRAALYMCALSARRYNPRLKPVAERLLAEGKAKKVVITALARRLLVIAYGVIKSDAPFRTA